MKLPSTYASHSQVVASPHLFAIFNISPPCFTILPVYLLYCTLSNSFISDISSITSTIFSLFPPRPLMHYTPPSLLPSLCLSPPSPSLQYLDALFRVDSKAATENHFKQVELYAKFEPNKLLPFLQVCTSVPLKEVGVTKEKFSNVIAQFVQ